MASVFLFVFFLLSHLPLLHSTKEEMSYAQRCPPISCGNLEWPLFPFANASHPECGLFTVDCQDSKPSISFGHDGASYPLISISPNNNPFPDNTFAPNYTLHIKWPLERFAHNPCEPFRNLSFPSSSFFFIEIVPSPTQTFFKCDRTLHVSSPPDFEKISCVDSDIYYSASTESIPVNFSKCSIIYLPKKLNKEPTQPPHEEYDLFWLLNPEIEIIVNVTHECYECHEGGGQCKARSNGEYYCDVAEKGLNKNQKIGIGALTIGVGVGVMLLVICCFKRKSMDDNNIYFWGRKSLTHQTIQAFLKDHGHLTIRQYNYLDIKKITNSFKDKLGEGGYGSVYKGKLQDGSLVAVKVLKKSKGNGDEFVNEVASISRTSHVNIVSLMGFCFEHSKRALIYEFMPNGSLEKFIYKKSSSKDVHQLEWEAIYKIAIGIAQGLKYLHKGCNTRILHFDIKPHNILLDENFCSKISDFGLAKVCCREQSIVSMLGVRGTVGYIAPEVFCRSIGGISHKSDVYSYGMLVLEMIGGRRNIEVDVDHTSEIFFPHWIHKRIEQDEHLGLQNLTNENDKESIRKMIIVGLWCIQTNPSNRPSMGRVVNMLEGLEPLQLPPKPILSSPSRSPPRILESSSTTMESLQ